MQKRHRAIGKMGEAVMKLWAPQGELLVNKAEEDEGAWDFYVQFEAASKLPADTYSLDLFHGEPECLIQVKATDTGEAPKVTLSNWRRFCWSPLPTFFLILNFKNEDQPQSAYLAHVDKKWITKFLKRMRQLPLDAHDKLHLKEMRISWSEKDKLNELNGRALRTALERHIGKNLSLYAKKKERWREEAGYTSNPRMLGTFTIQEENGQHPEDAMIDLWLGLRNELRINLKKLEDMRFNSSRLIAQDRQALLKAEAKPNGNALLRFSSDNKAVLFRCDLYNPYALFRESQLEKERHRLRFASKFIDFILRPGALDLVVNAPDPETPVSLEQLRNTLQLIWLLDDARKAADKEFKLSIQLDEDDKHFEFLFKGSSAPRFPIFDPELAQAASDAMFLADYFGLDRDSKVTTNQLYHSAVRLKLCRAILNNDTHGIRIEGVLKRSQEQSDESLPSTNQNNDVEFGYPLVSPVFIGKNLVVVSAACHGKPHIEFPPNGGDPTFHFSPKLECIDKQVVSNATQDPYSILPYRAKIRDWFREKGISMPKSFQNDLTLPGEAPDSTSLD